MHSILSGAKHAVMITKISYVIELLSSNADNEAHDKLCSQMSHIMMLREKNAFAGVEN